MKLYHAEISNQSFLTGYTKLDTNLEVDDDHSFEVESALGTHLRKNCPFILDEDEFKAFAIQKGGSLKDEETGEYFNAEYVPTVIDPNKKFAQSKKKELDPVKVQAENDQLVKDNVDLTNQVISLKNQVDSAGDDETEKRLNDMKMKMETLEVDKTALQGQLETKETDIEEANKSNISMSIDLKTAEDMITDLQKQIDENAPSKEGFKADELKAISTKFGGEGKGTIPVLVEEIKKLITTAQ